MTRIELFCCTSQPKVFLSECVMLNLNYLSLFAYKTSKMKASCSLCSFMLSVLSILERKSNISLYQKVKALKSWDKQKQAMFAFTSI